VWPVRPLVAEGGAQLFIDRARERDPHFELDAVGEDAVLEVCRRLDCMPPAIELLAFEEPARWPSP
jgi:predicted ATPase